jgi:N-acetylmuramoyl-L-alanine amidase
MVLPHKRQTWTTNMTHIVKLSRKPSLRRALFTAIFAATCCTSFLAMAQDPPAPTEMSDLEWASLETRLRDRANEIANSRSFFEDDRRPITVEVRLDRPSRVLFLGLDASFSKDVGGLELEDFQGEIDVGSEDLTGLVAGFAGTEWTIGGKDMDYWFNQAIASADVAGDAPTRVAIAQVGRPKVVVAAGHGAYFHATHKWTKQRKEINGVTEDDITQVFARNLASFTEGNGADAIRIRGGDVGLLHEPSGLLWNNLAARYFVENWRPENPELWNTKPESSDPRRELHQDIRSRPLYANFIGADAVVHLHTNAADPAATGTRILVHPGRPVDMKLAQLALCSMKEAIHSMPEYASYRIPLEATVKAGKGENSFARVPSMIVEVGFHTNVNDARLLQDPAFQKVSMRGLAKGMRLFREGASCAPFVIQPLQPVTANIGKDAWVPVAISGNPVYPIDIQVSQLNCGSVKCRRTVKMVHSKKEADAYRFNHFCWRGDENAPIEFRIEARDLEGVRTSPVTYQVKCIKPS